jgi:hypothetical protein
VQTIDLSNYGTSEARDMGPLVAWNGTSNVRGTEAQLDASAVGLSPTKFRCWVQLAISTTQVRLLIPLQTLI